jgi:hypothetical protein
MNQSSILQGKETGALRLAPSTTSIYADEQASDKSVESTEGLGNLIIYSATNLLHGRPVKIHEITVEGLSRSDLKAAANSREISI